MKKLSFIAGAALLATSAFAGDNTIGAVARMSWKNVDNDIKKTGTPNTSLITAEYARINFDGKLNASTKYYLYLNPTSPALRDTKERDATNDFLDSVGVVRTLAEGLTLNLGKQGVIAGGTELTHADQDHFARSHFYETGFGVPPQFGATLTKEMAGHTLALQLSNGNLESKAAEGQSRYGWAAVWAGDYGKGMIKPTIGYTVRPGALSGHSTNLLGTGIQFNASNFTVEADYGLVTEKKAATNGDKKSTSMVGTLTYTGSETLTPFVKFFKDTLKTEADGSKNSDVTAFGLGVLYKEAKNDSIRYHAVYTSAETKYASQAIATTAGLTGTNVKKTVGTIFVGATLNAEILK